MGMNCVYTIQRKQDGEIRKALLSLTGKVKDYDKFINIVHKVT